MVSDHDPEFDAVAAAQELDDVLGSTPSHDDAYVAGLEADIKSLNESIQQKDTELRRATARADLAQSEIAAATRRIEAAAAKELEQRTRKVLETFLSVIDDLDRSILAARQHVEPGKIVEGLELVRRSLLSRLGQFGVGHFPSLGQPFDPKRHEAVALVPVREAAKHGRVLDVIREGYAIGDDVLRPATVAVGNRA